MDREQAEAHLRMLAEITMDVPVVPPLSDGTDAIELIASGRSAEVRAILQVRWQ
jgi:hypothetical protein